MINSIKKKKRKIDLKGNWKLGYITYLGNAHMWLTARYSLSSGIKAPFYRPNKKVEDSRQIDFSKNPHQLQT